ncbi:MAG TPA: 50S ribosomal protein L20 [Tepidisphaeraceae bacterium]|jgi:large subunit ribosomal protein L20|nr:50S ribosomal protein L20 [Tepidisphaeraceae bacterium]
MARSTGGPTHSRKRKRILRKASGMRGMPGHNYRPALEFTRKADVYAYEHRKQKKRSFRALWITRLNAALKLRGLNYNRFIPALVEANITLNRKMLSELAISDPAAFDAIVEQVKPHIHVPQKA